MLSCTSREVAGQQGESVSPTRLILTLKELPSPPNPFSAESTKTSDGFSVLMGGSAWPGSLDM